MKKMMMIVMMVLGCVMSVFAQDHEFNKTLRKAENGDVKSQYWVGVYYYKGYYGCTKSGDKALYWWVKCVKNGGYIIANKEEATEKIMKMWQKEKNMIRDAYTAFNLIKEVSSYNCELTAILGDCYYEGFGTTRDYSKAMDCYEKVWKTCENYTFREIKEDYQPYIYYGHETAFRTAKCYHEGFGRPVNYKKAVYYYNKVEEGRESILSIYDNVYKTDYSLNDIFFEIFKKFTSSSLINKIEESARGWNEQGIPSPYIYSNSKKYCKEETEFANVFYSEAWFYLYNRYNVKEPSFKYWSIYTYGLGYAYEMGRGTAVDIKKARLYYACSIKFATSNLEKKYGQLAQQRLDALRGGNTPSNNVATINFTSSTSSNTTNYNLRACIKSSSQVSNVKITANGSEMYNSRGVTVVKNDGCDYSINQNISLRNGSNTITVSVTNAGGTTSKSFDVYVENSISEKRVALVIGNANYRNAPLKTPINDANDIAERLRTFGFDVTLKTNLTLNEFKNVLNNFKYKANNSDVALFYYAGHGMEVNQTNFLFPVDIESFCDGNGVDASLNVLNAVSGAAQKIIIIDACRNNPCRSIPGFKRMSAQNSFIAYSTSEGKLASDVGKNGRNSPYAEALLNALKWNSSMTLSQLFQRVNNTISTGQAPIFINSLVNDFVFNK